jgi:hypothetical protein
MSLLNMPLAPAAFSQAIISFWFRVPAESIAAAHAAYTGNKGNLDGIVPLVVMGTEGTDDAPVIQVKEKFPSFISSGWQPVGYQYEQTTDYGDQDCSMHGAGSVFVTITHKFNLNVSLVPLGPFTTYTEVTNWQAAGEAESTDPTCIGIDCTGNFPVLYVNFETAQKPSVSNYEFNKSIEPGPAQSAPTGQSYPVGTRVVAGCSPSIGLKLPFWNVVETSDIHDVPIPDGTVTGDPVTTYTDTSEMHLNATGAIYSDQIRVAPDRWHHVLISVNLKTVETHGGDWQGQLAPFVDSAAELYVALDDKNYTGYNAFFQWAETKPNEVITDGAYDVAGAGPPYGTTGFPPANYTLASPTIPSGLVGIPATEKYANKVLMVEMAEFQMFVNRTIDTGDVAKRRWFIAPKIDKKTGQPVPGVLVPVDPAVAAQEIGTEPRIVLHKTSNWKRGLNTGFGDNFTPIGRIERYEPDPSIKTTAVATELELEQT